MKEAEGADEKCATSLPGNNQPHNGIVNDAFQGQSGYSGGAFADNGPRNCPVYPNAPAATNAQPNPVTVLVVRPPEPKSLVEAYLLWFPLGLFGLHQFYLHRYAFGVLYLFTGGLFGIGWLVDGFRLPFLVEDYNQKTERGQSGQRYEENDNEKVSLLDAYLMWFPLGIIGLHHFYLRQPAWGVLYLFTGGLFGIGWLVDAGRMPCLVAAANERISNNTNMPSEKKNLCYAYAFGATPAGFFGAHHFYMGRILFGVYYMLTFGGVGVGWFVDLFRMHWLVQRANHPEKELLGKRHKTVDDAYVMAIPLGMLGLHHFYLERPCYGVLYLFTFGLCGIGWLVDLCRMPCLVAETNKRLEAEAALEYEIQQQLGRTDVVIDRSKVIVCQASSQPPAYGQHQSAFVVNTDPSRLGYVGRPTASSLGDTGSPPPYAESVVPPADVNPTNELMPPAYVRYGSMDGNEKN